MAEIYVNDYPVTVELALTAEEQACGLSMRDTLADDHGMLFMHSTDRMMTFWMKDTRIPLSIAFLKSNGTILNMYEMKPMDSQARYRSRAPARYALEMPARWFSRHRVKPGDRVAIRLPARTD